MSKNSENSEVESKKYKLMAKIYRAMYESLDARYMSRLLREYDIHYRVPENDTLRLCKPELINLSTMDFLIEEKVLPHVSWDYQSDIVDILLNEGADFTSKNNEGLTILHRLMRDKHFQRYADTSGADSKLDDKAVHDILSMHVKTNNSTSPHDENGISHFHIACMTNHVEAVEFFLGNGISLTDIVRLESPQYPGYTALHFAARCYSLEVADVLLRNGADLHVRDAKGILPLHLLTQLRIERTSRINTSLEKYGLDEFKTIEKMIDLFLRKENEDFEVNYTDDFGFSLLHAACAMTNTSMIKYYLAKGCDVNAAVRTDSPMWPGYTALHFAAHFKSNALKLLLENGGDIEIQDEKGVTPFDLIVTRSKIADIHSILSVHPKWKSIVLSDGKTKLISLIRAMREVRGLDDFLDYMDLDVNVVVPVESLLWPGNSPLHLAILFSESHEIKTYHRHLSELPERVVMYLDRIRFLVGRGANVNAENLEGLSPWKLAHRLKRECVISYLREMFPDLSTPAEYHDLNNANTQDKHADFAELVDNLEIYHEDEAFIDALNVDVDRQNRLERDFGLTMLHVACWKLDVDRVRDLLSIVNVNAQTHFDLPVWAGCTPLHLLMKRSARELGNADRVDVILKLLLENGADIMLTNAKRSTAIHATEYGEDLPGHFYYENHPSYANSPCTGLLLQRLEDFNANSSINSNGISHFHIACIRNDVAIIEKFLKHGANVNEAVDLFSERYAGRTPLYFAMKAGPFTDDSSRRRTMDLLMSHGADVFAEDSLGNTLLHAAAKSNQPREDLLERLIGLGLDIDAMNTRGYTPLEYLLLSKDFTVEELQVFTRRGRRLHSFNPISQKGYLSAIFRKNSWDKDENVVKEGKLFKALTGIDRINELDDLGRTLIHNVISDDVYFHTPRLIDELIDRGCDVDHRDNSGRTALHVAAELRENVNVLLSAGADINVVDENGESAFSRSLKFYKTIKPSFDYYIDSGNQTFEMQDYSLPRQIRVFVDHVKMMRHCGRHVSDRIANTLMGAEALKAHFSKLGHLYEQESDVEYKTALYQQIEKTKDVKFGPVSLYDFLSESRALKACRSISSAEYDAINEFFLDGDKQKRGEFDKVFYIAKRLYKNISARLSSIGAATSSLSVLLGFPVPDLCSDTILRFLSNKDLEKLIASSM